MARFCTLASGSSGNSTYISTPDGDILVDAGISYKALLSAFDTVGGNMQNLRAVAITHSHIDHIKGLKTLLKNINVPLVASSPTLQYLSANNFLPSNVNVIACDSGTVVLGDIALNFFATNHDALGSGGYTITLPDTRKVAVCTDLGIITNDIRQNIYGCDTILIESNHDVEMLRRGAYPAQLKLRILSDEGHLSNNACALELPKLLQSGTKRFILGHLSAENNTPLLAASAAKTTLAAIDAKEDDYILKIAKPKIAEVTLF